MTIFQYPTYEQYQLLARYPGTRSSTVSRGRSALQINLDVRRTRRAAAKGR